MLLVYTKAASVLAMKILSKSKTLQSLSEKQSEQLLNKNLVILHHHGFYVSSDNHPLFS